MPKGVIIGLIVFLILAGAAYVAANYALHQLEVQGGVIVPREEPQAQTQQYASEDGYSFQYPNTYELSSQPNVAEGDVLVLLPKGYEAPAGGEGPATIAVISYPDQGKTLDAWLKTDPRSNWELIVDARATRPITVGGKQGMWYHHTGLYENDVVAVSHKGRIILFTVGYMTPEDTVRHDFDHLVESVQLY